MAGKDTVLKQFGAAMRKVRLKQGLSQEALGYEAELHRTFISEVERGLRNPSLWTMHRLAKALGVRVRDLV